MQEEIVIKIRAEDEATPQIEALAKTINKSFSEIGKPVLNLKGFDKISVKGKVIFGDLTDEFLGFKRVMDSAGSFGKIPLRNMTLNLEETKNLWEKLQKPVKNFQNQMDQMDVEPIGNLSDYLNIAGLSEKDFNKYAEQNFLTNKEGVGLWDNLNHRVISYGSAVGNAVIQSRRFQFGWLGIMFAGMALERAFGGIISAQMELYGITAMTTDMWTILMAPAMETVSTFVYDFINAIMNLPEDYSTIIGWGILFGWVAGQILGVTGQIVLFLASMKILGMPITWSGMLAFLGKWAGWLIIIAALSYIIWKYVTKLAKESEAYRMATPPGMKDIEYKYPYQERGTRQFVQDYSKSAEEIEEDTKEWTAYHEDSVSGLADTTSKEFENMKFDVIQDMNIVSKDIMNDMNITTNGITKDFDTSQISINDDIDKIISNFSGGASNMQENWGTALETNWTNVTNYVDGATKEFNAIPKNIETIHTIRTYRVNAGTKTPLGGISGGGGGGVFSKVVGTIKKWLGFQYGGIMPYTGLAYLHAGEKIIPAGKGGEEIILNVSYNIQVSDKREMERLLKDNNIRLVDEVKRMVAV